MTDCLSCDNTGWRSAGNAVAPCECRHQRDLDRLAAAAGIPDRFAAASFENFRTAEHGKRNDSLSLALTAAKRYCEIYPLVDGGGILYYGPNGSGKTHLLVAIVRAIVARGFEVKFVDYNSLLAQIRATYNPGAGTCERSVIDPVINAPLLAIDDLGATRMTEWVEDTVCLILNSRYNSRRPTLATTNRYPESMAGTPGARVTRPSFEEFLGKRVASRLHEMCRIIEIQAGDCRRAERSK